MRLRRLNPYLQSQDGSTVSRLDSLSESTVSRQESIVSRQDSPQERTVTWQENIAPRQDSQQKSTVSWQESTFSTQDSRQESTVSWQESIVSRQDSRQESNVSNALEEDKDDGNSSEASNYGEGTNTSTAELEFEKMTWQAKAKSAGVVLLTSGGIAAYLTSFVFLAALSTTTAVGMTILGVAGGAYALTTPVVLTSEWRLTKLPTLRGRINALRTEAALIKEGINSLVQEEESLREEVKDIEGANERLKGLVKGDNKGNIDELVRLVQENQLVIHEQKQNLRQQVVQDVVRLVLQCDRDRDNAFSRNEATHLERRLSYHLHDIYGISFDAEKFYRAVGLGPSLYGVMRIVKRLLPDKNNRLSSFYDIDSDDDEETILTGFEEDDSSEDDMYDMFYVNVDDEFNKGCTDSIQMAKEYVERRGGERPSLMSLTPSMRKGVRGFRLTVTNSYYEQMSCREC